MAKEWIGYGQGCNGQYIAVRGTRTECLAYARANPGMSCHIRRALKQGGK